MRTKTEHQEKRIRIRKGDDPTIFPISISKVQRYDRCPRWFKYETVDRLPRVGSDPAELGDACHQYVKAKIEGSPIELDMPMRNYAEFAKMQKLLDDLAADSKDLAALEETVIFSWQEGDITIEMESRIDRLDLTADERAIVTDYKTGWYLPSDLEEDSQGLAYCLGVHVKYPNVREFIFRQVQVRFARVLEIEYSLADVLRFQEVLRARARVMLNDTEYKPKPGDHCRLCPYSASHCDVGAKLLGRLNALTDAQSASEEGEAISHLEALLKRRKDALRAYVEANGPVQLPSGDSWGFVKRSALRIPDERLEQAASILEESGYRPDDFIEVRFNMVKGRRLLKGKHAVAGLEQVVEDRPYTVFGLERQKKW